MLRVAATLTPTLSLRWREKRGKPAARLAPFRRRRGAPFGLYRDEIRIHGDIGAPIDVEWDAETGKNWIESLRLSRPRETSSNW